MQDNTNEWLFEQDELKKSKKKLKGKAILVAKTGEGLKAILEKFIRNNKKTKRLKRKI